ncbi:response regulator [Paenibacillus sp. P26]|nr:response regulator [Paenibacillus sp. P26]
MRLMIVDDEPIIRSGLQKMAQSYAQKFEQIETAENGIVALERIALSEPDLLLTDIRMPKMDGLELCKQVHERYPHMLMVVVSGYDDFDYAQKCLSYGVKHYLLKPVTPPDLHEAFDQILKSRSQGYIPFSRYVDWLERVEQSIWCSKRRSSPSTWPSGGKHARICPHGSLKTCCRMPLRCYISVFKTRAVRLRPH